MQKKQPSNERPEAQRVGARKVSVDAEHAGQRIDNFLRKEMPGLPRSRLYRVLRKGEVRVNGGRVRAEYRLQEGDIVRIPPARLRVSTAPPEARARAMLDAIIYEDKRLLVINKPPGVAVHGGSGVSCGVVELLRAARADLKDVSLAHRLDRSTSGCLVLAKRRSALREMHAHFRDGRVAKRYLALVAGDWQLGDQQIDAPLYTGHRQKGERHVVVSGNGKTAQTDVSLSRTYGKYSLLVCSPLTGRTHQLRVHLAHAGHPIAGDTRYGDEEANRQLHALGLRRLFLHAQSIAFADESGNDHHFSAALADDLHGFLQSLPEKLKHR